PYDPSAFPSSLLEGLMRDPESLTYQFVVMAYPLPHEGLTFVQGRFRHLSQELRIIRESASSLDRQLDEARGLAEAGRVEIAGLRASLERASEQLVVTSSEKMLLEKR